MAAPSAGWAQQPPAPTTPGRADAGPRFDILEFVVEGDTLLGAATIERAVYEFLGPQRTVADAESARKALEKAYQDAGYLSVSVLLPPQRVDGSGEVRLQVVQAPVDKLRVTGAQYHLPSEVKAALPSLAPGSIPNFNEMQQELGQLAQASSDREITPILSAGDQPATINVELKVQDKLPAHGYLEANSRQALDTKAGRLNAGFSYDNLFQRGHMLGFDWIYAPRQPRDANIKTLNYALPLGGSGDRLNLSLTNSSSDIATSVGGSTVSRGSTWRLRWRDALPAPGLSGGQGLSWGLTYHDLRDRNISGAGDATEGSPLRYTTLNAAYDLLLAQSKPGRSSTLQAEMTVSLPGVNRHQVLCGEARIDQFVCKRSTASSRFQVFGLTLSHREPIGAWSLYVRLQGQFTDVPLVPAEQVVYGGQDSVRGYYEGEQAGDLGAAWRLELNTPAWASEGGLTLNALAFYDGALLRRLYASANEVVSPRMASGGLGLRLGSSSGLEASLFVARVLKATTRLDTNSVQQLVTGRDAGRLVRWDFSLRQSF